MNNSGFSMDADQTYRTSRLILTAPSRSDVRELFQFMGDTAAMQFTQVSKSIADCEYHISTHEAQRISKGYAPWTIREIGNLAGEVIGWGGLYDDPFDPGWGIELAYRFAPQAWGRGYATELAEASLAFARNKLRHKKVAAFAHPENAASRRVLEKVGFSQVRYIPEMNRLL